jgi:WD40 repeat protein
LAFLPDGKAIAWMTIDNVLRLSDAATGKLLHKWPGTANVVESSFSFSPDSRLLALACQKEMEIPLYDTHTGKELRRLVGHRETVYAVGLSPDGKTAVSSARDATLRFWDVATGKELRQLRHDGGVWRLAFAPDGLLLATGGWNVQIWDASNGKQLRNCDKDDDGQIESLAFSPDGKTVAASRSNSHAISFWDVASGKKQLVDNGHLGPVLNIALSPDGKTLATAAWEKNYSRRNCVHLWDPLSGKELGAVGVDLGFIGGLAFSPDSRLLAVGNEDGTIRLFDYLERRELRRLEGHQNMIEWLGTAADGTLISLGYHDRTIRLWDVPGGKELGSFRSSPSVPNGGIALAPDGKTIAQGGSRDSPPILCDALTGKKVRQFGGPGNMTALAISPDGQVLAAGEMRGVRIWEVASGKELGWYPNTHGWIGFLSFSPNGRLLGCGSSDGTIVLWDTATGKERNSFKGHHGAVRSGAFSPDGRRLYSGSDDTTVLIWDLAQTQTDGSR